ncbi:hypothetical protein [Streptomyces sp. NPDC090445]|uniref:hypothetical protein n=1 Tax=Streptomyces sp. NPDC090445 TaxID=3365963 RepID=UPI003814140D
MGNEFRVDVCAGGLIDLLGGRQEGGERGRRGRFPAGLRLGPEVVETAQVPAGAVGAVTPSGAAAEVITP